MSDATDDFSFRSRAGGEVAVFRRGTVVTILRGSTASRFLARVAGATPAAQQLEMVRVTGNYRRGNERVGASHPRNRRD
ncbi:MAG: hypothetical protein ABI585_08595 [Betaproteobacteria bacterium]